MKKLISTFLLTYLISVPTTFAQQSFSATFSFAGTVGHTASLDYNGTAVANLTVSALTKNGVTSSSSTGNSRASAWTTGATTASDTFTGARDMDDYFEFTVSPAAGYTLSLTAINFGIGRSGTGPRQAAWASDVNYASLLSVTTANASLTNSSGTLTTPDANLGYTGNSITLSGGDYTDLSGSRTFRFYMWNSESAAGTGGLQGNLSFTGSLSAIPEPSTYAAIFGGLALAGAIWHRRRQRKAV